MLWQDVCGYIAKLADGEWLVSGKPFFYRWTCIFVLKLIVVSELMDRMEPAKH